MVFNNKYDTDIHYLNCFYLSGIETIDLGSKFLLTIVVMAQTLKESHSNMQFFLQKIVLMIFFLFLPPLLFSKSKKIVHLPIFDIVHIHFISSKLHLPFVDLLLLLLLPLLLLPLLLLFLIIVVVL